MENLNAYEKEVDLAFTGLSSDEVNARIAEGNVNKVKNKTSKSYWRIFFDNFCTFFNLLCFICFFVLLSVAKNTAPSNFIFVVLFVANSIIGVIQEIRAKRAVERLSLVKAPTSKVLRNGKFSEIGVSDLVLDDIIELTQGAQIPADCVVLSGTVEVNESLLTGESVPLKKSDGDELLSGSFIVSGKCLAKLTKVGKNAYVQQLTEKAKVYQKTNSKLLDSLNKLIKSISIMIIPVAIGSGIVNYYVSSSTGALNVPDVVIKTCSVVIGMIPCGMFFLTTLSLAVGVIKLAKLNTWVQDMYSLEMLARVNVLCLDKTGTITDGNLKVREILPLTALSIDETESLLYKMEKAIGDENQTAIAVTEYLEGKNYDSETPIYTLPFSSARKYALASFNDCTLILGAPNYVVKNLSDEVKKLIGDYAKIGARVVLFAKSDVVLKDETLLGDVKPLGLVVLEDNVRPEAVSTINWFQTNDVTVKVVSGDDPVTVSEIAKRAGVIGADKYVDLQNATDEEVISYAKEYVVFGRVSPEQKALIIKTIKDKEHIVGMTGDGVNDILAMKESDCSVTVATGSSAARSLAHLVLVDDNFNSLPQVVREGRRVVNNIQRSASLYLMKTLFTFIFAIISIATLSTYPFTTGMMLMLEFLIIGLPSVALSIQPNAERIKGKFISYVLYHAIPGAIVLVFNALAIKLLYSVPSLNITEDCYSTLLAVSLTLGGLAFLTVLCYPYDKFRTVLAIAISVVVIGAITLLTATHVLEGFFALKPLLPVKDNVRFFFILIGLFLVDYVILLLTRIIFKK